MPPHRQQHGRHDAAAGRRQGENEVTTGVVGRALARFMGRGDIASDDVRHLAAHEGAVALVEVHQRVEIVVVGGARVGGEELLREGGGTVGCQIHGEEGNVGAYVSAPETLGELDAIEDGERARPVDVHVLQAQVAMPFAHPAAADALGEEAYVLLQKPPLPHREGSRIAFAQVFAQHVGGLLEVVFHVAGYGLHRPLGRGGRVAACVAMEGDQTFRQSLDVVHGQGALPQKDVGATRTGDASHRNRKVDDLAGAAKVMAACLPTHRDDALVDAWRQSLVQAHLVPACPLAEPGGALVEKGEGDGLLDLERPLSHEEDPRYVGFHTADGLCHGTAAHLGVGRGVEQIVLEGAHRHRSFTRVPSLTASLGWTMSRSPAWAPAVSWTSRRARSPTCRGRRWARPSDTT